MTITFKPSPNKSDSSFRKPIDRIVIHWFGIGTLDSATARFTSPTGGASAHYAISDKTVVQYVTEDEVAWHAGNWEMNCRSIGIEHDATTTKNASEETYKTSAQLVAEISKRHSIPLDRQHVIKHSEVSPTQCCGTLDINKIITMAKAIVGADPCSERVEELEIELDEMRDSRNRHKAESAEKSIKITALETEIENRKEQVTRLEDLIKQKEATVSSLLKSNEAIAPLQAEIKTLQTSLEEFAKGKGALELEVTQLKEEIKQMNSQPRPITFQEVVDAFFAKLMGRNGNTSN